MNLMFVTVDLAVVEDLDDSSEINYDADEPKIEPPG